MKIGVLFPSRFEDPGEFLADARAMEAAGADSVWFEESDEGLDPMLALAAIAAVTTDLRLGLLMVPSHSGGGQGRGSRNAGSVLRFQRIGKPGRRRSNKPAMAWRASSCQWMHGFSTSSATPGATSIGPT